MFIIQGPDQRRSQTAENALAQPFLNQGYIVLDSETVTQTLRRNADLLKLPAVLESDIEAAKRLGSRAGADIVVRGEAKSRVVDKTYTLLENKKVSVSQADISVRMVLARNGTQIMTAQDTMRKPFDMTGEAVIQKVAESVAGRLLQGLEDFLNRDTTDYRLVVQNVTNAQALAFQEGLRNRVKGVRQVDGQSATQNVSELKVSVDKAQDLPFKQSLSSQLSGLGLGTFEVVAREGETIVAHRTAPSGGPSGTPTMDIPKYRKSWAVLIGINEYQEWPKLRYAVKDAQAVEKLVRELGFDEVIVVLDSQATREYILRILGDELHDKTQDDDRVFIFFAGHGQTQDLRDNLKDGFIIPVDGKLKDYYSTAISMLQLQGLADRTRAKQMFFVIDACFSGVLKRMRLLPGDKTRQVLTAGSEGEQVGELGGHGLFTKSLLDGLSGAADDSKKGYITASELYQYVSSQVLVGSRNLQNPVFGRLDAGQGEFVFVRK